MAATEEEIYSIMFTSLKHPVRRKILRMLADKPMTFMEMVETLGVSTSHLTYHLEALGELLSKSEELYYLSTFGQATVSAMKTVEEVPEIKVKQRINLPNKWKAFFAGLLVCVILLASLNGLQYASLTQMASAQESLRQENNQMLSWGVGTSNVASMLHDVVQLDITKYKTTLLSNTLEYRSDIGAAEEFLRYSLTSSESNLDVLIRFRDNHISFYQITPIESKPILTQTQPNNLLDNAKATLQRYKAYTGDAYLDEMINLLSTVNTSNDTEVMQGNMKLRITFGAPGSGELKWYYTEQGIDYSTKSLDMVFENWYLKELTDGYFLFSIGNNNLAISQEQAVIIAKNYVKTLKWNINGQEVSGFNVLDEPISVQFAPHPRTGSSSLIPYWYIVLRLDKTYSGGINTVTVGIYADNGEVQHIQMLSS